MRDSLLLAVMCWALVLQFITECASAFHLLHRTGLCAGWAIVAAALCIAYFANRSAPIRIPLGRKSQRRLAPAEWFPLCALLPLAGALFTIAIVAPPNTWDAMSYHLPRVMHWTQNRSLDFYECNSLRQLFFPAWAELAILNVFLLWGNDRLVNTIQFFAMLFSLVCIFGLAREYGAKPAGQLVAVVFAATLPMLVLQATGAKNDAVLSLWILSLAFFLVKMRTHRSWLYIAAGGAALGLAMSTKGSALLFAAPLLVAPLLWKSGGRWDSRDAFRSLLIVAITIAISLAVITPHSLRNLALFGGPLGPPQKSLGYFNVANDRLTPEIFAANIVRNLALHAGTPFTPVNSLMERAVSRLLGAEISNPASTWPFSHLRIRPGRHDDNAGNPLHLLLIVAAICALLLRRARLSRVAIVHLVAVVAGFLLFSLFLRWQPFHSRLMLPLFLLCAPLVGVVVSAICGKKTVTALLAILLISVIPWVTLNKSRPLFGPNNIFTTDRTSLYFANRPLLEPVYRDIARYIAATNAPVVGLAFGEDDWEYPLHALLRPGTAAGPKIAHVLVNNRSAELQNSDHLPSLIVSSRGRSVETIGGVSYPTVRKYDNLRILAR